MASPRRSPLPLALHLQVPGDHPQLLQGLEIWLQLGLVSDTWVLDFCQEKLTCLVIDGPVAAPVPVPVAAEQAGDTITIPPFPNTSGDIFGDASGDVSGDTPGNASGDVPGTEAPTPPVALPAPVPRGLQAVWDELGVMWLLVVGVFLVVVSSGVLAATQWQLVPPVGQYGILLAYTLVFWQLARWTGQQAQLHLTSRTLHGLTLLVIPVNFWAMGAFGLVTQGGLGLGLAAIAAIVLAAITRQLIGDREMPLWLSLWGLYGLHWGWPWGELTPWMLCGGAAIGAGMVSYGPTLRHRRGAMALTFAILLLLGRSALMVANPAITGWGVEGLALGIVGWSWLRRGWQLPPTSLQRQWGLVGGAGCLGVGWMLTLGASAPGFGVVLGGLLLALMGQQVRRTGRPWQWGVTLGIAVLTYVQVGLWIPAPWRAAVVTGVGEGIGTTSLRGVELAGVALFPLLWAFVAVALEWRRRQRPDLALITEGAVLAISVLMLLPGLSQQSIQALSLLGIAGTLSLGDRWRQRFPDSPTPPWLAYGLNGLMVLAGLSLLDWRMPELSALNQGLVLVGIALGEWAWMALRPVPARNRAPWYIGIGIATLSYTLLQALALYAQIDEGVQPGLDPTSSPSMAWGLLWLLVPVALTGLTHRHPQPSQRPIAGWLGVWASGMGIGLGVFAPWGLMVSGTGAALVTGAISRRLSSRWPPLLPALTVGWGLWVAGIGALVYVPLGLSLTQILPLGLWGLWMARWGLRSRPNPLAGSYRMAMDGWGVILALALLGMGTMEIMARELGGGSTVPWQDTSWVTLGLGVAAIAVRLCQQPTPWGYWLLAWGIEVLGLRWLWLTTGSLALLPWGNVALALGIQMGGDVIRRRWRRRRSRWYRPRWRLTWAGIPLVFGLLAVYQGHLNFFANFAAATGAYTLGAGLVAIGIGRRYRPWRWLTGVGIAGLGLGAYELLIYQLLQQSGGDLGDGITLLALLGAAIAGGVYGSQGWLARWWRWPAPWVQRVGHGYWAVATACWLLAPVADLSDGFRWVWIGVALGLMAYALGQGRRPGPEPRFWMDGAVVMGIVTALWGFPMPMAMRLAWGGAIAAAVATLFYQLPWPSWGWPVKAGQNGIKVTPGAIAGLTTTGANPLSHLLVGAFYGGLALGEQQIRLSYVSVVLANLALGQVLQDWGYAPRMWPLILASLSVLYIAQVDPALQHRDRRQQRHWVRLLGVGLVCLTAILEAGTQGGAVALVALLGLGLAVVGLGLRVRAYTYGGTLTFGLEVLLLLWIFISREALLLWGIGLALGLGMIWLAATFESRRSQFSNLWETWLDRLADWD